MIKDEFYTLYNGVKLPKIGFGTWQIENGDEAYNSCMWAIKYGYTHIDTAFAYGNEESVAKAIKNSNVNRKDIFITTKLPSHIKSYDETIDCFNQSLINLQTSYIDLYLIHAPWPWEEIGKDCSEGNIEVWKAMIKLYNEGKIRAIGVSNFSVADIKNLIDATGFKPMVNQIRYFIGNTQDAITNYCQENDILVEAYSPLATGNILEHEEVIKMAQKYNTTTAKICIRYCLEKNTLPLPKSVKEHRIIDNLDVNFKMEKQDVEYLDSLKHIGPTRPYRS